MKNKPKVYLITGGTGAGKTTHAIKLADALEGLRFSIDDWMVNLFWMDSPEPISHDWAMERINRAEVQIWDMALQIMQRGTSVVLDLGFTKAGHREKFAKLARAADVQLVLCWADVDKEERWSRVEHRNRDEGETFAMTVTRDMFDFMEKIWEPPTPLEMQALNGTRI